MQWIKRIFGRKEKQANPTPSTKTPLPKETTPTQSSSNAPTPVDDGKVTCQKCGRRIERHERVAMVDGSTGRTREVCTNCMFS